MLWLFIALGCAIALGVDGEGELTVQPIDLVAVAGSDAVFSCRTQRRSRAELPIWRRRVGPHSLFSNAIASAADARPRTTAATTDDDGRRRLDVVIESVRPDDAGDYRCLRDGESAVSRLVVLPAAPNCTVELLGDFDLAAGGGGGHLSMRCAFGRRPGVDPATAWYDPAGREFLRRHLAAAVVDRTRLPRRHLVARPRPADGADFRAKPFELSFAASPPAPGYAFNWSGADVAVVMSLRNVRVRANSSRPSNCCYSGGRENLLYLGDELICDADGQPGATYRWQEVLEPPQDLPEGRRLILSRRGKHAFRCTASQRIRDVVYNVSLEIGVRVLDGLEAHTTPLAARSVEQSSSEDAPSSFLMAVVVPVGVVVVVVVVAVAAAVAVVAVVLDRCRSKPSDDAEVAEYHATQAYAATPPAGGAADPAPPSRRGALPLPAVADSSAASGTYEDVEDAPETPGFSVEPPPPPPPAASGESSSTGVELAAPGDGEVRGRLRPADPSPTSGELETPADAELQRLRSADATTPKSVYEPLQSLDLHSSPVQETSNEEASNYIRINDVAPFSRCTRGKDSLTAASCCRDAALPVVCGGQNSEAVVLCHFATASTEY